MFEQVCVQCNNYLVISKVASYDVIQRWEGVNALTSSKATSLQGAKVLYVSVYLGKTALLEIKVNRK